MNEQDKLFCMKYMLESTFATSPCVEKTKANLKEKIVSNPLYPSDFYHYTVRSDELG